MDNKSRKEISSYFFKRIDSLSTGERALLRRESGVILQRADGKSITTFYRCLPSGVELWQEDRWFAVACLRCLWEPGAEGEKPLEKALADLIRSGELSDSAGHRVELLLDTKWDTDGYLLTKLARLMKLVGQKTNRAPLDFPALLEDLLRWNSETQTVQRKWARTIFSNDMTNEMEE